MKDIPVFTTEYGVASLTISQIESRGEAFVRVQDVQAGALDDLLGECVSFCRMLGAEQIYADRGTEPAAYAVLRMSGLPNLDLDAVEHIFPVTRETVASWREIYNASMAEVHHARHLAFLDEKRILESGGAYFVHRSGKLLGIGWLQEQSILAIAACKKGNGYRVAQTLLSVMADGPVCLEVSSNNFRAIRLYERLGLVCVGEVDRWYKIF